MLNSVKKPNLNIGIPAYNEQENIKGLINNLLNQKNDCYKLNKIIVISDASGDNTNKILKSIKNKYLNPIFLKVRKGQPYVQNIIIKNSDSDLLLFINADTKPENNTFIDNLVKEIIKDDSIGIVSAETISQIPSSFFERVIVAGREFKKWAYKNWNGGNNIYLCHGRARVLKKTLYKNTIFPDTCPEDAYSYLNCIRMGYKFRFVEKTKILFKSPNILEDHKRQSNRFFSGKRNLNKYFDNKFIDNEYGIPEVLFLQSFFINVFRYHIYLLSYFFIFLYTNITNRNRYTSLWSQIGSSKKI